MLTKLKDFSLPRWFSFKPHSQMVNVNILRVAPWWQRGESRDRILENYRSKERSSGSDEQDELRIIKIEQRHYLKGERLKKLVTIDVDGVVYVQLRRGPKTVDGLYDKRILLSNRMPYAQAIAQHLHVTNMHPLIL